MRKHLIMPYSILPRIRLGTAPRTPQTLRGSRVYPQRGPGDGRINWSWSAERIYNFVRAQTTPYPGAFSSLGDRKVTIWRVTVREMGSPSESLPQAGEIRILPNEAGALVVGCGSRTGLVQMRPEDLEGWSPPSETKLASPGLRFI